MNKVVAFIQFFQHHWYVARIVLKIPVDRNQIISVGVLNPSMQRRSLTIVTSEENQFHTVIADSNIFQNIRCSVVATVVNKQNLKRTKLPLEHVNQFSVHQFRILNFVEQRNDN